MSERDPVLKRIIAAAVDAAARDIYTCVPAKVVKWDADKQRANCQILVKLVFEDEEGERKTKSHAVVTGVPVQVDGAGGYRTTYPISDGNATIDNARAAATTGWLCFSHVSLDKWLSGNGREVDPEIDHYHAPSDAFFLPGLKPFGAPWSDVPTDHMTLGKDGSEDVQIHLTGSVGRLGAESGAEFMAMFETFLADLKSFVTTLNTVLLAGTAGGPTNQQLTQAAQIATTQLFTRLQALSGSVSSYLSTKWKNK